MLIAAGSQGGTHAIQLSGTAGGAHRLWPPQLAPGVWHRRCCRKGQPSPASGSVGMNQADGEAPFSFHLGPHHTGSARGPSTKRSRRTAVFLWYCTMQMTKDTEEDLCCCCSAERGGGQLCFVCLLKLTFYRHCGSSSGSIPSGGQEASVGSGSCSPGALPLPLRPCQAELC